MAYVMLAQCVWTTRVPVLCNGIGLHVIVTSPMLTSQEKNQISRFIIFLFPIHYIIMFKTAGVNWSSDYVTPTCHNSPQLLSHLSPRVLLALKAKLWWSNFHDRRHQGEMFQFQSFTIPSLYRPGYYNEARQRGPTCQNPHICFILHFIIQRTSLHFPLVV